MLSSFASLQVTRRSERSESHNSLSERTNQKRPESRTGIADLILSSRLIVYVARALGGSLPALRNVRRTLAASFMLTAAISA